MRPVHVFFYGLTDTQYRHELQTLDARLNELKDRNAALQITQDDKLQMITEGIQQLRVHPVHKSLSQSGIEDASRKLSECHSLEDDIVRTQEILSDLHFEYRPVRHAEIHEAHMETFQWVFQSKFATWLREQDGAFWVSGKAGSGKSTLMKFMADHPTTFMLAEEWSAPYPVIIASHYFWNPGSDLQRSQIGLLRSLLFGIFKKAPELIRAVCPRRWDKANRRHTAVAREPWSLKELSSYLKDIATRDSCQKRFCFFIDGLDEFSCGTADHVDLCQALQSLARSRHVKLCVSSRPWPVFEDFFGKVDEMRLFIHELTRDDMRTFARSRLSSHPHWDICCEDLGAQNEFIETIVNRAEGVFLWVYLVTRSLREGLSNDDTLADMHRRLDSLPTDLEELFKGLLSGVDKAYQETMAAYLRITLLAYERPLPLQVYYHHSRISESEHYLSSAPEYTRSSENSNIASTSRRVNSRTRGLLEVHDGRVTFLHRTVSDFLATQEMEQFLLERSQHDFDPLLSICEGLFAHVKFDRLAEADFLYSGYFSEDSGYTCVELDHDDRTFLTLIYDILCYGKAIPVKCRSEGSIFSLLDALEHLLASVPQRPSRFHRKGYGYIWNYFDPLEDERLVCREKSTLSTSICGQVAAHANDKSRDNDGQATDWRWPAFFRRLVLRFDLSRYASVKLSENPFHFNLFPPGPVFVALDAYIWPAFKYSPPPVANSVAPADVIRLLLAHGHDPNQRARLSMKDHPSSLWCLMVQRFLRSGNPRLCQVLTSGIVEMLLSAGADPNCDVSLLSPAARFSAFAQFLLLPLETHSLDKRWRNAFSTALRYFLDAGADLDYEVDWWDDLTSKWGRNKVKTTVCAAFASGLSKRLFLQASLADTMFFANLTRQLLAHGIARKADVTPLVAVIPEVFTATDASSLFQIVPVEMRPTEHGGRKREYDDSSSALQKRLRTDGSGSDSPHCPIVLDE